MNIETINKDGGIINIVIPDSERDKIVDDILKHVKLPKYKTVIEWGKITKIKCETK